MKKYLMFLILGIVAFLFATPVHAQIDKKEYDGYISGCFHLWDTYKESYLPYLNGERSVKDRRWDGIADDLRWNLGVYCGAVMTYKIPDEYSAIEEDLLFSAYYFTIASELKIASITEDSEELEKLATKYFEISSAYSPKR